MERNGASLTIGRLAAQCGVPRATIRFYEREGLLPKPARTSSGYRHYPESTVGRLRFVARAKGLGFSLKETRELISIGGGTTQATMELRHCAAQKIQVLDDKLRDLRRIRSRLAALVEACPGAAPIDCPIFKALSDQEDDSGTRS